MSVSLAARHTALTEPAAPEEPDSSGVRVRRWSTSEYHRLAQAGLLGPEERVELIDGEVMERVSPIGSPHRVAVYKTVHCLETACGSGYYVDAQAPIVLADGQEPQPDAFVAVGTVADYGDHHPRAEDVRLVVEVSDATLGFDRGRKAMLYGEAGIGEYWLLDLAARRLEVRQSPAPGLGYRTVTLYSAEDTVRLPLAATAAIPVSDLLP